MAQHDLTRGRQLILHGRDGGRLLFVLFAVKELAQQAAGALLFLIAALHLFGHRATLVLKNVRNFSFCASISSCVSSLRLSSFGILVPPCSGHGGLAAVSYSAARWLWISYRMMPAATETLKLSTPVP